MLSLTEPGTHRFGSADWSASPRDLSVSASPSPELEFNVYTIMFRLFYLATSNSHIGLHVLTGPFHQSYESLFSIDALHLIPFSMPVKAFVFCRDTTFSITSLLVAYVAYMVTFNQRVYLSSKMVPTAILITSSN